jgi:hypothetical protein
MGASQSLQDQARFCKYTKKDFITMVEILQDAQEVLQFYASSALIPDSPKKLPKYPILDNESYYNGKRLNAVTELEKLNIPSLSSVYDAYNYIKNFQLIYETAADNDARRLHFTNILGVVDVTINFILKDIQSTCTLQGLPPPQSK